MMDGGNFFKMVKHAVLQGIYYQHIAIEESAHKVGNMHIIIHTSISKILLILFCEIQEEG
jgi:hypothetical protein